MFKPLLESINMMKSTINPGVKSISIQLTLRKRLGTFFPSATALKPGTFLDADADVLAGPRWDYR